jgi:hypothetical protein
MGRYTNQYVPTIYHEVDLGSVGIVFRTVDYEGSIKFENNGWVFDPVLTGVTPGDSLPDQTSNSGKYLTTDGSNPSWSTITHPTEIPTQTGNNGKYLTTNGTSLNWATVSSTTGLPDQLGNSGKILTTNGTAASWMSVPVEIPTVSGQTGKYLTNDGTTLSWATVTSSGGSSIESTSGIESLTLGSNPITFSTEMSTADYDLHIRCYNTQGDNVNYRIPTATKLTTGFIITVAANSTLEYRASYGDGTGTSTGETGGILTINDNILDWDSTNNYYRPYITKPSGSGLYFYTGTANPDGTTRLNLNGTLYTPKIVTNTVDSVGIQSTVTTGTAILATSNSGTGVSGYSNASYGVYGGSNTSYGVYGYSASSYGVTGMSANSIGGRFRSDALSTYPALLAEHNGNFLTRNTNVVEVQRVGGTDGVTTGNTTGNLIYIYDNPTTSGTISGKVLSATIGTTERISLNPRVTDGSTAVSYILDTHTSLSNATAKLLSLRNSGSEKAFINTDGELELTTISKGIILKSPDGTRWRITVADTGVISAASL